MMSKNNNKEDNYEVGYGKPPQHTRFAPGRSGNPKGRPKGAKNMRTVLLQALNERVVVNENGRRKTITKLEAATKQLVNKAAAGELRSIKQLSELLRQWDKPSESGNPIAIVLSERDMRL